MNMHGQSLGLVKLAGDGECDIFLRLEMVDRIDRLALFRAADVLLDTSANAGLNLMPFEFITAHHDDSKSHSSVIVSEFSGCSRVLLGSIRVNPWNTVEAPGGGIRSVAVAGWGCRSGGAAREGESRHARHCSRVRSPAGLAASMQLRAARAQGARARVFVSSNRPRALDALAPLSLACTGGGMHGQKPHPLSGRWSMRVSGQ